ncbi:hypothetical protein BDV39DRAFT_193374 [Aspergillus sergii]|uniref:Uncharacterized protein n=1 Tax=Aspergillus sergii TaxID=1034303 RepID=A0A5N6X5F1_9EURO|nr:hypothetical protein BDV39DRAFT_193374 [Aspergillus sergii]
MSHRQCHGNITRVIAATKKGLATRDMSQFYLPFQYDNRAKERVSARLQNYQKVKSPNVFFSLPQHCTEFSREDRDVVCSMLGMRRSASLKFWQPAIVWALDSVGLGKTWETVD